MQVVIVRHGETKANAEGRIQGHWDGGLSDQGRAQAAKLRASLEAEGFDPTHIYSSPLGRCMETANIVAQSLSPLVVPWDELKERGTGILSGLTWAEAIQKYPEINFDLIESPEWKGVDGVEPLTSMRGRSERVVSELVEKHRNDDVVLMISHGGIMQTMLGALMGTNRTWGTSIGNTGVFDFTLDVDRWSNDGEDRHNIAHWYINRFNDTSHLDALELVDHRQSAP